MSKKRTIPQVYQYPVVVTNKGIWLVKPENHQKVRAASAKDILDSYISDRGIFHAVEDHDYESKIVRGKNTKRSKKFRYNYVSVIDSLTGNNIMNIYPEGQRQKPVEERLVNLDFSFGKKGKSLAYVLNGEQGELFKSHAGPTPPDMAYNHNDSRVYFCGRRVARFDKGERIRDLTTLSAKKLDRLLRRKNPKLLQRWRSLGE